MQICGGRDLQTEKTARAKIQRQEDAEVILGEAWRAVWLEQGYAGKQLSSREVVMAVGDGTKGR